MKPRKSNLIKLEPTVTQTICEIQLNFLLKEAMNRPLTLEEIKSLDLLSKNLNLAKGSATEIIEGQYAQLHDAQQSIPTNLLIEKAIKEESEPSE